MFFMTNERPKLKVTVTGEFPAQMVSNAENVSIWWRHHQVGGDTWSTYVRPSGSRLSFYVRRTLIWYTEKI